MISNCMSMFKFCTDLLPTAGLVCIMLRSSRNVLFLDSRLLNAVVWARRRRSGDPRPRQTIMV